MDTINISLIIVAVINSGLGLLLIYHREKGRMALVYAVNILSILLWIWGMFFYRISDHSNVVEWTRILYLAASTIASSFVYFTYYFPTYEKSSREWLRLGGIFGANVLIAALVLFSPYIIDSASVGIKGENIIDFGKYYYLYVIYILGFFSYGFWRLLIKFKTSADSTEKARILYLFLGYAISANLSFFTNLILPWFGFFEWNWFGQLTTITMVSFAVYAMLTYRLFDVRVITTEILTFFLWLFLLFRTVLSEDFSDQVINGSVFVAAVVVGMFLIRSIIREVESREKIEKLARDLEKANERLRELDKQKSEFLSFATHQLRSPLTSIKGYSSLMLDGTYGVLPESLKEPVDHIFQSTQGMVLMVDDFLNISRIEQGRMKYEMANTNISKLAEEITAEMKPVAEKKNISLSFKKEGDDLNASADPGKLRQVIANLIDNSIKYTPQGEVNVAVSKFGNNIRVTVSDTGVGISKTEIGNLFEKFSRAKNANKVNVTGTGLGLYLAKKIIEAHNGKIWAESLGEGKGSSFVVEFPIS